MAASSGESNPASGAVLLPLKPIRRLDEAVVNRIAAGEIIHRPANAIKELLENSLDAGATAITITLKDGGLKLIQIVDNGHGIRLEDMPLVCERFTTSKITKYEDLQTIATFGFRGEALASISHVAHVTITSMTADAQCAYRAQYSNGRIIAPPGEPTEPKFCAGKKGTQISVEDLFYNDPLRRKALRSPNDEFQKVADVVTRYAIHYPATGFTLKKHGQNAAVIHTPPGSTITGNIRTLFGAEITRELLRVEHSDEHLHFRFEAYVTNANYNRRKGIFIFFINNRLVNCNTLKKAIEGVYASYLPRNTHPFVYLRLDLDPHDIDVNVHPTKKEVQFLHESDIVEAVMRAVDAQLLSANSSRTFYTAPVSYLPISAPAEEFADGESVLTSTPRNSTPHTIPPEFSESTVDVPSLVNESSTPVPSRMTAASSIAVSTTTSSATPKSPHIAPQRMVRTDARDQRLEAFLPAQPRHSSTAAAAAVTTTTRESATAMYAPPTRIRQGGSAPKRRKTVLLTSIQNLLGEIETRSHPGLAGMFRESTFVGIADANRVLVQSGTKLYLVNAHIISRELFYQQTLYRFENFSPLRFDPPLPVRELVRLALECTEAGWTEEDGNQDEIAENVEKLLLSKAPMLAEYFAIEFDERGQLAALPEIVDRWVPDMERLPMFLLRLGVEVDWQHEQECFEGVARELANFYSLEYQEDDEDSDDTMQESSMAAAADNSNGGTSSTNSQRMWQIEHVLAPSLQKLVPRKEFASDGTVVQIACLENLYKIFERC